MNAEVAERRPRGRRGEWTNQRARVQGEPSFWDSVISAVSTSGSIPFEVLELLRRAPRVRMIDCTLAWDAALWHAWVLHGRVLWVLRFAPGLRAIMRHLFRLLQFLRSVRIPRLLRLGQFPFLCHVYSSRFLVVILKPGTRGRRKLHALFSHKALPQG